MSDNERRYRTVECAVWGDRRFRALSAPQPNAQTVWLYLLTGPETTSIPGVVAAGPLAIAEGLGWGPSVEGLGEGFGEGLWEGFRKAWAELCEMGMVKVDQAGLIFLPAACNPGRKSRRPASPNVVTSWQKIWRELPECELKGDIYCYLKAFTEALGEGFAQAFAKAIEKPSPHPSPIQCAVVSSQLTVDLKENVRRKRAPASGDHSEFIEYFNTLFHEDQGAKPTWNGKSGAIVKRILKAHGLDECKRRADILFAAAPRWITTRDIQTLEQHFDKLAKPAGEGGGHYKHTGDEEYAGGEVKL